MSLVDLNRSGVALMEIVTKPDLRSADEAKAFLGKLRTILRYLGTCDGDMEKGHLRADVNVSVRKPGDPLGTRCEIKNLNSIRFIGQAIEHEARRQIEVIEDGGSVEQETRLSIRTKSRGVDTLERGSARLPYFRIGLLPLDCRLRWSMSCAPVFPNCRMRRGCVTSKSTRYRNTMKVFWSQSRRELNITESMLKEGAEPKAAAKWLINEYLGRLNRQSSAGGPMPVTEGLYQG